MKTIRISDSTPNGVLAVDLSGILRVVGSRAAKSVWRASAVEASIAGHPIVEREEIWGTGDGADELDELTRSGVRVSGARLVEIAKKVTQIIWGEFKGYDGPSIVDPWIIIIAFDGTWFEVRSIDDEALSRLQASFKDVSLVV
jgi:hypothetical protein